MSAIFEKMDKIKPLYDKAYQVVMLICKLLLITEIILTSMVVFGRYTFGKSPAWGEEIILTCMVYMALLSAAMAIRRGAHIRMTAYDHFLSKRVMRLLDLLSDSAVLAFAIILIVEGTLYAKGIGGKGSYTSLPMLSKFWLYFPVPFAGVAMLVFELEAIYNHIRAFFNKEKNEEAENEGKEKEGGAE